MVSQLVTCLEGSPAEQQAHADGLLVTLAQAVAEPHTNWSDRSASASHACHHQTSIPFSMLSVTHPPHSDTEGRRILRKDYFEKTELALHLSIES